MVTSGEFWAAILTVGGSVAVALFHIGQRWGRIEKSLEDLHENQQAIADVFHVTLPHPKSIHRQGGETIPRGW